MSAKPHVNITLGRRGQVVKRRGAGSEVPHSDYKQTLGGKRPIIERLGNDSDGCCNHSQGKRQRSNYYKWSLTDDDQRIGQNDLRLKLLHKGLPRQTNMDSDIHDLDHHEKLLQAAQMSVRFDTCRHETESMTSGSLERIPLKSQDDLLHMNCLRRSYSPWPLDGFVHRNPDRLPGACGGLSPPRNCCDDLRQVPNTRSVDPPRSVHMDPPRSTHVGASRPTPVLAKCIIDAPRPTTFASKAHVSVENPKPVMQLPLPNGVLKASYVAEEPTSVGSLLHSLGLGKYAILFEAEEVDMAALKQMGDSDLKELGIPMGPRKKILAVTSRLRQRHA